MTEGSAGLARFSLGLNSLRTSQSFNHWTFRAGRHNLRLGCRVLVRSWSNRPATILGGSRFVDGVFVLVPMQRVGGASPRGNSKHAKKIQTNR